MDEGTSPHQSVLDGELQSMVSTNQSVHRKPRTRSRISAACIRCQKRKIRCDGMLPACSGCQKAGVRCIDGGTSREIPRSYLADLEARVMWLESIVRERCPDIDLGAGPGRPSQTRQASENSESQSARDVQDNASPHEITEQMGLISVSAGADLRYIGPSSGLFFTRFVLAGLSQAAEVEASNLRGTGLQENDDLFIPTDMVQAQAVDLPADKRHATLLSRVYFDSVHLQYPFLHEPTHMEILSKLYNGTTINPEEEFQAFMVLAIGATILSRRSKRHFPAEGYYASAMQRLEAVFKVASLGGVQCLLLLQLYTIHNPASGLSIWTIHYHALSSVLELGLQRDVRGMRHFSLLQVELRTRAFWSVYCIDRLLSTTMGRPVGIMDEQCELRLPMDINDHELSSTQGGIPRRNAETLTNMSSAIHLFKLARFNSEIKCVLYCVDRQYPPYTAPSVLDVNAWQLDTLGRLRQWKREIPQYPEGDVRCCISQLSEIRYHELVMLVLRPNPVFQQPTKAAIRDCFASAIDCSQLYARLYRENKLQYGWINVHSLFLCMVTLFYCVWTPNGVADEVDFDCLANALKSASDILSATGEYWPEAKSSRDVLDHIFSATTRRFSRRQDQTPWSQPPASTQPSSVSTTELFGSGVNSLDVELQSPGFAMPEMPTGMSIDFPPYAAAGLDSFMTTDWLSFFMNSDEYGSIGGEGFSLDGL